MKKIKFFDGSVNKTTPLSAENLNKMQDNIELEIGEKQSEMMQQLEETKKTILQMQENLIDTKKIANEVLLKAYPIGSIYTSINNVNPSTLFGGKWTAFAKGKTLFGVDTADNQFATVEKTGGKKTHTHATKDHTLTIEEMPKHSHRDFMITPDGNEIKDGFMNYNYDKGKYYPLTSDTGESKPHNHGNTTSEYNIPPYITVYFWKRTA